MANYVKFLRGTPRAYSALQAKDVNTLYFIVENNATSGHLYLGDKEIVCNNQANGVEYLKDLLDVSLPENLGELLDGQVLTYDVATESWVARTPEAVAEVKFDNKQFETNEAGEVSIVNFANAPSGAQLTKSADGALIWVLPDTDTAEGLVEAVETLRTDVDSLTTKFNDYDTSLAVDNKIAAAIAGANHLSYITVDSTDNIDVNAENADKYIYLVKNGDIYDEYMVINNKLEKIGDWSIDLSDYAKKEEVATIETRVEDLASKLNSSTEEITTIKGNIVNIQSQVDDLTTSLNGVSSKVDSLELALNAMANTVEAQGVKLTELENTLADKVDITAFNERNGIVDNDIAELRAAMSWNTLPEIE